jgi:hypothetical protein
MTSSAGRISLSDRLRGVAQIAREEPPRVGLVDHADALEPRQNLGDAPEQLVGVRLDHEETEALREQVVAARIGDQREDRGDIGRLPADLSGGAQSGSHDEIRALGANAADGVGRIGLAIEVDDAHRRPHMAREAAHEVLVGEGVAGDHDHDIPLVGALQAEVDDPRAPRLGEDPRVGDRPEAGPLGGHGAEMKRCYPRKAISPVGIGGHAGGAEPFRGENNSRSGDGRPRGVGDHARDHRHRRRGLDRQDNQHKGKRHRKGRRERRWADGNHRNLPGARGSRPLARRHAPARQPVYGHL